jgi:hypothetical protein
VYRNPRSPQKADSHGLVGAVISDELNHQQVLLTRQTSSTSGFKAELLFDIDGAAVALAVCIERWAKARARG